MAKTNKQPKTKHTFADRMKVYKKRFAKLDKKTKLQVAAVGAIIVLILVAAVAAMLGKGKNPTSSLPTVNNSMFISGSYDPAADNKYEDEYTKLIREYDDVVIPKSTIEDKNYFRETIFVGDSNTEGLAVYNHLSLQYVMGVTGMPINTFTTNRCMWFVGYEEPVTMPVAISMMKPRRIIMNFGTNNCGGTETEDFIKMYKTAIKAVEKAYPYTDIIVAAVLPVAQQRDYPYITMQDIDSFNLALAEMCREIGYKFLNTAEVLKNPDNGFIKDEYIAKDGIHLSSEGFKTLLDYVDTHKHVMKDERPARGNIPTRRNPPVIVSSSEETESSSEAPSSSSVPSSSLASSSVVSSAASSSSASSSSASSSVPAGSSSTGGASSSSSQQTAPSSSENTVPETPATTEPVPTPEITPEATPEVVETPTVTETPKCSYCNGDHTVDNCTVKCAEHGTEHNDADCPRHLLCTLCNGTGHTADTCELKCLEHGSEHLDSACERHNTPVE